MMVKKVAPKGQQISGWYDLIHKSGEESRQREIERKRKAKKLIGTVLDPAWGQDILKVSALFTAYYDEGVITCDEFIAALAKVLGRSDV